jgi:hypothetical protein
LSFGHIFIIHRDNCHSLLPGHPYKEGIFEPDMPEEFAFLNRLLLSDDVKTNPVILRIQVD